MSVISLQAKAVGDVNAGIFTWELSHDKFCADRAVAAFFDLNDRMAENGLPITCFLDRIDPRDRPRVAKSLHDAILSGNRYQESYRVVHGDGSVANVTAMGRCFRDESGEPSHYAGIIFPKSNSPIEGSEMFWRCLAAFELAHRGGHLVVAAHLRNTLRALECRIATAPLVCMH